MTLAVMAFLQGITSAAAKVFTVRDGSRVGWHGMTVKDKGRAKEPGG